MTTLSDAQRRIVTGALFVGLAAVGFSAKAVLVKLAYAQGGVDAITLMALRMALALPFFLAAAWHTRGAPALTPRDWATVFALGLIGYYVASLLDFMGLAYISAGLERLILYLYPTLVLALSVGLERRALHAREGLGLVLSYAGIVLAVGEDVALDQPGVMLGAALVSASAAAFAVFIIGSARMLARVGSPRFTAHAMTAACLATILHFGATHELSTLVLPASVYGLAFIMAVASTVAPAFLMMAGLRRVGAARASILGTIGPVSTIALAYLFLGETLGVAQLAGMTLVLTGVTIASMAKGR